MAAGSLRAAFFTEARLSYCGSFSNHYPKIRGSANICSRAFRASQEPLDDDKNKFYKELGMFSLRKRIEDSVLRAEMLGPTALELAEAKHVNQEEVVRDYDLWDDLGKSNEILTELANSAKVVETLKDLKYKAEEAKLITELAEMDAINYALFKQAYYASLDVNKFLDKYEMSKLLKEPYDMEGACITIESKSGDLYSEVLIFLCSLNIYDRRGLMQEGLLGTAMDMKSTLSEVHYGIQFISSDSCFAVIVYFSLIMLSFQRWTALLAQMYMKWAERQGHAGRIVERQASDNGGIKCATIELEFRFSYGYLSGERGVHSLVRSFEDTSALPEVSLASVDVIPLFIESSPDLLINDGDILVSYPSNSEDNPRRTSSAVHIQHLPTGLEVQSTGERSRFANKIKALDRLKARLLVVLREQGISSVESIKKGGNMDRWSQETRKYFFQPTKMVRDLKTGIQLSDVNAVLNGNLDPLIAAHINSRQITTVS